MRSKLLFCVVAFSTLAGTRSLEAVEVSWITQYCNEDIQTADLSGSPRMLANITNSLMTAAPSYLDESVYLQRRSNFRDRCPELDGIGEESHEWLRSQRVSLSHGAVVVAAVREEYFPGAGALLTGLGWTPLGDTITIDYVAGAAPLQLYAGLVHAGPVSISGSGVNALLSGGDENTSSMYFFFQNKAAFSQDVLLQLRLVPEPGTTALLVLGAVTLAVGRFLRSGKRR